MGCIYASQRPPVIFAKDPEVCRADIIAWEHPEFRAKVEEILRAEALGSRYSLLLRILASLLYSFEMLDIKFIRENLDLIKEGARKKHIEVDLDRLAAVDDKRKELLASIEEKRAMQNRFSER